MKKYRGVAALIGAVVLLCAVVAWAWYAHVSSNRAAPQPVQQIAAPAPAPTGTSTSSPGPVTYVPVASPTPASAASPSGPASASPVRTAPPTVGPYSASAAPSPSQGPVVAATLAPHVISVKPIVEPPNAPPHILAMSISTPVAHAGDVVSGTVETTSNVASVEARIGGYSSRMEKIGVGKFALSYRVPYLPFFLHRTYQIEVIARNTKGDAARSSFPITIR